MNPRYPTTRQFRRHRNERKLGRPLLALGLLAGVGLYWIFSGPSTPKRQPEMASVAETRALEEEIAAHLKTTQTAPTTAAPASETGRKEALPDNPENRRAAVIDSPSLTDPTGRLDAPETLPVVDPIIKDPARVAALKNLAAAPARKSAEESRSKSKDAAKTGDGKSGDGKSGDAAREPVVVHEVKKESHPKEEGGMPSAPADLPPKSKPPDLDMTFYRELPKRKVVVPLEEPLDQAGKPVATTAEAKPSQTEKNNGRPGAYVVQLAVFNDSQRASAMVADLQRRGVPAKVVKSKEGTLYRVRLGPFPTQAEANRMMNQWKLGGQSALIFQDHEG
ncbi:hypothetical protein SIID45300_01192 [Candidatus Magnetaquicoccaceae bacterium FCR-1]|uniref:SPOR domain-containing protein n=1 Tax=Candidatus Magnetaquiglobus chichijimensis TaxID=3141448 RepID=A0ABQ0C7L3_9PROT